MKKGTTKDDKNDEVASLLRDLLIATLGTAGVKQADIRRIAGCSIGRVNEIVKHIEQERKRAK